LVLGERADRTLIRSGEESCTVEAMFDVKKFRCSVRPVAESYRAAGSTLHYFTVHQFQQWGCVVPGTKVMGYFWAHGHTP
jgi:hypothetical protein